MSEEVAPWTWRELDSDGALATWTALSSFVDWLVGRYDLGDTIPRCWYLHGALTEELTALWASWTAAYLDPEAEPDAPITWHERFAACRERLASWDRLGCAQRGHRDGAPAEWELDVEAFTEEHLTAEAALLAFRDEDLIAFGRGPRALCLHCHHVLFHGQLDRVRIDPGEVEVGDELITASIGVHRHHRWASCRST